MNLLLSMLSIMGISTLATIVEHILIGIGLYNHTATWICAFIVGYISKILYDKVE